MACVNAADTPLSPPFVVLGDGVVTLRCLRPGDVGAMLAGEDDDQVRWLTDGRRSEPARTADWIRENQREWRTGGPRRNLGIVDAATGVLAGMVEAHLAVPELPAGTANVAYAVFPPFRGRGYAARAVLLVCDWLARSTDATAAAVRVDPENLPSLGVAREAGFVEVGPGPEGLVHHVRPLGPRAEAVPGPSAHLRA